MNIINEIHKPDRNYFLVFENQYNNKIYLFCSFNQFFNISYSLIQICKELCFGKDPIDLRKHQFETGISWYINHIQNQIPDMKFIVLSMNENINIKDSIKYNVLYFIDN